MAAQKLGIFPGTFDPFTNGHFEVVKESLRILDKIQIAIGVNPGKSPWFSPEERVEMISDTVKGLEVEVVLFSGLVAEYAKKIGATALVRGLRTESDFSYEMPMAMTNKMLAQDITTIFLPTSQASHYLSSSLVREVASHGREVSQFVPAAVFERIKLKLKT